MRKGPAGTGHLNPLLQQLLNPPGAGKAEVSRSAHAAAAAEAGSSAGAAGAAQRVFRVGDRVIQLVNNYDKDIFNGDQGTVGGRWARLVQPGPAASLAAQRY